MARVAFYAFYAGILRVVARQYLTEAATLGDVTSQCNLGRMWLKGIGGVADRMQASIWYQKAADQGDKTAIAKLAELTAGR